MRVGQTRLHVHLDVGLARLERHTVRTLLEAQVDAHVAEVHLHLRALAHVRARDEVVEDGLDNAVHVLEQQRHALLERLGHLVEPAFGARNCGDEAVRLLTPVDPGDGLHLRVDDEREASALADDRRILRGERVSRQTLCLPARRFRRVREQIHRIKARGERHAAREHVGLPLLVHE